MVNYIPDTNPFSLAGPPKWFLQQLWEFDSSLVIVPSRQGFFYRLAQRRKLNIPEKMTMDILWKESDTRMLATYSLVPVTTILATVNWGNPLFFEELRRRAPWRQGGADEVLKRIDDQETKEELDRKLRIDDTNTYLAKDAWKMYQKKVGLRSHLWSPKTPTR
jgi:hypothetical protein